MTLLTKGSMPLTFETKIKYKLRRYYNVHHVLYENRGAHQKFIKGLETTCFFFSLEITSSKVTNKRNDFPYLRWLFAGFLTGMLHFHSREIHAGLRWTTRQWVWFIPE